MATEFLRKLPTEQSPIDKCPICYEPFEEVPSVSLPYNADQKTQEAISKQLLFKLEDAMQKALPSQDERERHRTTAASPGRKERALRLPCSHVVGSACIKAWFSSFQNTCPLCRKVLFPPARRPDRYDGNDADQALVRLAEREPGWTLNDLQAYLRRRLGPHPPPTEAEVEEWWLNGRQSDSNPDLCRDRGQVALAIQVCSYQHYRRRDFQLPPLYRSTDPRGLPTPDQMEESHVRALFIVLESRGAFAHHFWHATTRGASGRQI